MLCEPRALPPCVCSHVCFEAAARGGVLDLRWGWQAEFFMGGSLACWCLCSVWLLDLLS